MGAEEEEGALPVGAMAELSGFVRLAPALELSHFNTGDGGFSAVSPFGLSGGFDEEVVTEADLIADLVDEVKDLFNCLL